MPTPLVIVRKKKPSIVTKKEETRHHPTSPTKKETLATPQPELTGQPVKPKQGKVAPDLKQKVDNPKGESPASEKVRQHLEYLKEIESLSSPETEIIRACYFLCFLINENRTTTTLFPLKDKVLKNLYESGHDCLMVNYVRRGDRLTYRLTQAAKEKWESETGGKRDLIHLYRTPGCFVQSERAYYDLYQFHIVVEPFRFLFLMPQELASWVDEGRLQKPRLHTNMVIECGLCRGRQIKMSRKATGLTDEQIAAELQRFLDTPIPKILSEREDVTEGSVQGASPRGCK